ncbi:MAG TPA: hypothetical protein VEU06_01490, partial [Micropepsaceae bacterium]|nr:hypothetical protein [Micropepsaceae bacterium]
MSIAPFKSSGELIDYARLFLRHRVKAFRKDIRVCLTADKTGRHAYFPGLIACITFLDQLSGLYSGKLEGHNDAELTNYATKFLGTKYPPDLIALLYHMFRHKLAHLGHPYAVFDTATRPGKLPGPRRRITWTVYASRR